MANCIECGKDFTGRPDQVYCSKSCRKRAENNRAKMQRIMTQLEQLPSEAETARFNADYHRVRLIRARVEQLETELSSLAKKYDLHEALLWLQRLARLAKTLP